MQMYSGMVGMLYTQAIYKLKWDSKIKKNLKRVIVNGKVSKEKLGEAFKFHTIDPKLVSGELLKDQKRRFRDVLGSI
jgi:hypothetical protein